mmetsp:Transcript_22323/g.50025  ORF Transcript_22323/g.50025 Transcript_22323/m.50025 type:complete len:119 (-) Transcript_22323:261-617(-)
MQAAKAAETVDTKTACESELIGLCDAIHSRSTQSIARARANLLSALGGDDAMLIDAIAVVSFFNGIADRIADATGLQVESRRMKTSVKFADESLVKSSSSPIAQGLIGSPSGNAVAKL